MPAGTHSCDLLIENRLDETGAVVYGTAQEVEELVAEQVWPTFFETSVLNGSGFLSVGKIRPEQADRPLRQTIRGERNRAVLEVRASSE